MSLKCEHRHNSIMLSKNTKHGCLRETKFDSFLDAMIGSLLSLYVECCSHLF